MLITLSSPTYTLHAIHAVLNCPATFCSNFIMVQKFAQFLPLLLFKIQWNSLIISWQGRKKCIFVVIQWIRNSSSLCLAPHDTVSKYPQLRLWCCFVSLFDLKIDELHIYTLLKIHSIKLQTSNFLQAIHSSTYTLREYKFHS